MNPNITSIKPRGIGIFIKSAAVSSLIALMALAVFAWTMIRYEQTNIFKQIDERGNLLAASLDRVTANAIVAEDWESVFPNASR